MAEKAPALPEEESPLKILPTDTGPDSIPTQPPSAPAEETKQTMGQQQAKRLAPSLLKTGLGIVILVALGVAGWLASRSLPLPTFNATPTLHLSTQPGQFATSCENDREKLCIRDYSGAMLQSIQLPLSDEFGNIDGLSWGPDGHQLVLAIGRGESTKTDNSLFIYDLETNQIQRLTNSPSNDVQPAWSPDGKWIAYHSSGRAILISPDSGQQKQLAREYESRFMANNFAWSPDSEWLAWLAREPTEVQTLRGLMLVAMKNFSVTLIPYAPGDTAQVEYNLAWDPYGQFLYLQAWNQQAIHFDMSCLKTSCQGLTPEQADGNIPREWAQDYYPQWGLEVP
jgi:tricorn protease-like protein